MDNSFEKRYIEARNSVIEAYFPKLNPMQRKAVMATEGPLLILAGAGSGKTTVIINRIANLLKFGAESSPYNIPSEATEEDIAVMLRGGSRAEELACIEPVEPWRVLAITFTNKAAGELKARLEAMLGETANDIWASTFHSACVRILRRNCELIGFPSSFTIYDTSDSISLVKHILKDMDIDDKKLPPRSVLGEISRAKDACVAPEEMLTRAKLSGDIRKAKIAEIYAEYSRRSFNGGAMDFDDLIFYTVKLLQEHDEVREYWQRRFKYVLIDEYQDTNHLQYLLAKLLSGGRENICVVGDDDQSIYKFRGATIENILDFESEYPACRTIRLEQNYRSTAHILDAANAVIRNNCGRKGKELWTAGETGELLELYCAENEHDEARYVASKIMNRMENGGSWSDNAILYRMNAQSNQFEQAFKRNGIPYRIFGGTGFFDRAEIKDVLAYLCVIAAPSDDLRLTRIVNNPPRGIGDRSVELAAEIARREFCSLFEVLKNADKYPELSRAEKKMRLFANMIIELKTESENLAPDILYELLLEKTGYLKQLEDKDTVEDAARAENVRELKSSILNYKEENSDATLEGYLADVALYTDLDNYDKDSDCVVMMTMHSAKGLEFGNVFVVGAEETIFPSVRSIGEPEELEEERRLCYVALTRAKQKLFITCARQRLLFGRTSSNKISRFVEEIPEAHIEKRGIPKGFGYSEKSSFEQERGYYSRQNQYREKPVSAPKPVFSAPAESKTVFAVGDKIRHRAFGTGELISMRPMGNDYFIEIRFDSGVNKKLMLRAASAYMEKI